MSYYKGCNILKNQAVDGFLQGYEYVKVGETGGVKKQQLEEGTNKYNYQFLVEVKDLIYSYCCLVRLNCCVKAILGEFKDTSECYDAINTIWGLIKAQSGTVRYLRCLKSSLKLYKIKSNAIYKGIKAELEKTKERYERNKQCVNKILRDYGLDEYIDYIEKECNKTIYEDIFDFFNEHKLDITSEYDNDNDKYTMLDNLYIQHIYEIGRKNNLNLEKGISDNVKIHIANKKRQKELLDKERKEEKRIIFEENCKERVGRVNSDLNDAIRTLNTSNYNINVIKTLVERLKDLGNQGYYISLVKSSNVYFITKDKKETTSIQRAVFFSNKEDAQEFLKELDINEKYYIEICDLFLSLEKGQAQKTIVDGSVLGKMNKYNEDLNNALNYKKSNLYLGKIAVENTRDRILNSKNHYYVMKGVKQYVKEYANGKVTYTRSPSVMALYSKEDAELIAETLKGYSFEVIIEESITDEKIDYELRKYDEGSFDKDFVFSYMYAHNLLRCYYIVVYDRKTNKILYYTLDNTFSSNKYRIRFFETKPVMENYDKNRLKLVV